MRQRSDSNAAWPPLPYGEWRDTATTLHLWLQIVGKIRVAQCPWVNHSWHVTLQTTARGLGTRLIWHSEHPFQIDFDFIAHRLLIRTINGGEMSLPLEPQTTAAFYRQLMNALTALGAPVSINTMPNELLQPLHLDEDDIHCSYDAEYVNRYWRILVSSERIFERFRAGFTGKCSPVHFFWGSADLAVTRFSGRRAPAHPGGVPNLPDWITREAYSHEVSSAGFWAGGEQHTQATYYSYAYPEPPGFASVPIQPETAHYDLALREFVLPYDEVRTTASPEATLLAFLESTYVAAAERGGWNRAALEWDGSAERGG